MSGNTITQSALPTTPAATAAVRPSLAPSRAARELGLKRGEFDLGVRLGCIRTLPDEGGGGSRVARAEIDRVRSETGFPEALRERVKAVGTAEGAALMGVSAARFTRFARLGLITPVKWYLNRYRAVVWLYLAEELRQFAASEDNAPLLSGRTPEGLRDQLDAGVDLRAWTCGPATGAGGTWDFCCGRPGIPGSAPRPWRPCWIPCRSRRSSRTRTNAPI